MQNNETLNNKIEKVIELLDDNENGLLYQAKQISNPDLKFSFNTDYFETVIAAVDDLFFPYLGEKEIPKKFIPIVSYLTLFLNLSFVFSEEVKAAQDRVNFFLNTFINTEFNTTEDGLVIELLNG